MGINITTEQFKQEVFDLVGDEYTVLGEYRNRKTKILMEHNVCGYEYTVRPEGFLRGSKCPKCAVKERFKTTEEFKQDVYDKYGDRFTILGEYTGVSDKIHVRCNVCGYEFKTAAGNILQNGKCRKCANKSRKKTQEEFEKEVFDLVGDEYTVLSEYKNTNTKILMRHNECGYEWRTKPSGFLRGNRCPKCWGRIKRTHDEFVKEIFEISGDEYTVLGEYINANTKIKMRHNKCGHEWEILPSSLIRGIGCPICGHRKAGIVKRKGIEKFKEEVFDLVEDEYTVLGDYVNTHTAIKIKHNVCGNTYEVEPRNFLSGNRCPICKSSAGEQKIAVFLTKNRIKFETEKTFEDLLYKGNLRYDFYLPKHNTIIEYDGEQHYKPATFGNCSKEQAVKNFKASQIRDDIKNKYCEDNGIRLIRIPYYDFDNIKEILAEKLL